MKDLEGKLDQIPELEDQLRRGRLDLEKRQEVFLTTISDHIGQAIAIKERLEEIKGKKGITSQFEVNRSVPDCQI